MSENIILHFKHFIDYMLNRINVVGAGTISGIRSIPSPSSDIAYVRKYGVAHTIKDLIDLSDPGVANLTWTVKNLDGTVTFGSRANGGAFSDGSTVDPAEGVILEASASGGSATLPTSMTLTDADFGALSVKLPAETVDNGETITFYVAESGSTYYDSGYKYGGSKSGPGLNTATNPFRNPAEAYTALGANDGVQILDSATYGFPKNVDGFQSRINMNVANTYVYSSDGQAPVFKSLVGASAENEAYALYNNATAVFFNENGDDGAAVANSSWQNPYLTFAAAKAARGSRHVVYGGTGATVTGGVFNETITVDYAGQLSVEEGYTPIANWKVIMDDSAASLIGWTVKNNNDSTYAIRFNSTFGGVIYQCTITDAISGGLYFVTRANGCTVSYCKIHDLTYGIFCDSSFDHTFNFYNNIFYNCSSYATWIDGTTVDLGFEDNIVYDSGPVYIRYTTALNKFSYEGIVRNTIYNSNGDGMHFEDDGSITLSTTIQDNIVWGSAGTDIEHSGGGTNPTISYSNYETISGMTDGGNNITTDPNFSRVSARPYFLGVRPDSGSYKTGSSGQDRGARWEIIELNESNLTVHGIEFDGNNLANNGILILDTADHTDQSIRYNTLKNFSGNAIDLYDNDTDTDSTVNNNKIFDNGSGIILKYGGNEASYNLIYNNIVFSIWSDYINQVFDHNVYYGNKYGLYLESNSALITVKNSISYQNTTYGIYSDTALITVTSSLIMDVYNTNVDVSDSSNKSGDPRFVSLVSGSEDFHIKTKEGGNPDSDIVYKFDSVCKDSADDGYDIGAYLLTRTIQDDSWKKYQLSNDPTNLDRRNIPIEQSKSNFASGSLSLYAKSHKKLLPLIWSDTEYSTEEQYDTLEYISTLIKTEENLLTREGTKIRALLLPDTHLETGTAATIDATEKTITLASKSWTWNKYKGWWADILFETGTGTGQITASTKKLAVAGSPGPGWTTDQWSGYILYHNYRYYYILSNTSNELTLSDPDSTLSDESGIDWQIQQSFRITTNDETILTVLDPDSKLISGSYNFVIDFMECVMQDSSFGGKQLRGYDFEEKEEMTGYALILQES